MTITDPQAGFSTDLNGQLNGTVLYPGDPEYAAEIASFNLARTPRPAIVVCATGTADVAATVRWATARGLQVAVRSTGHGGIATLEGAVLVSTGRMSDVTVDPGTRTATVGAGARWSQVIAAAQPHGLAPLNGSSSQVGVVGYTLGGGVGPMGRRYGFAADHVTRLQLVTADGTVQQVTADSDPELFWAIRGGKGNFGIVTELEFALMPVTRLYGGGIFYPIEAAPDVLHTWREWTSVLPETSTSSIALLQLPPDPALPAPLQGRRVLHQRVAHFGHADEGAALLAPMRAVAAPIFDTVGEMPYAAIDSVHMDPTGPMPVGERSTALRELPAAAIDALLAQAGPDVQTPLVVAEIRQLGGALARPAPVPNAVSGRDAAYNLFAIGVLAGPAAELVPAAAQALVDALGPWSTERALLNFHFSADPAAVGALWDETDRQRLLAVKGRVDPAGMFHTGQAIG